MLWGLLGSRRGLGRRGLGRRLPPLGLWLLRGFCLLLLLLCCSRLSLRLGGRCGGLFCRRLLTPRLRFGLVCFSAFKRQERGARRDGLASLDVNLRHFTGGG